ncbi:MAG: hypothetical protein ACFFCW_32220 [Candidatus Hodarchaeota archaeon]
MRKGRGSTNRVAGVPGDGDGKGPIERKPGSVMGSQQRQDEVFVRV